MGLKISVDRGVQVRGYSSPDVIKCLPSKHYVRFPQHKDKVPGDLIVSFKVLPHTHRETEDADIWWTYCQFSPSNDSIFYTTSTAFHVRQTTLWSKIPKLPAGRVCKYDLNSPVRCENVRETTSTGYPKLQVCPNGITVATLQASEIRENCVVSDFMPITRKATGVNFNNYKDFCTSPDGNYYAILSKTLKSYSIVVFSTSSILQPDIVVDLKDMYPDFKPQTPCTEHSDMKWSSDSSYVAASLSYGPLIIVNWRKHKGVCSVFDDIIPDTAISSATSFDFDPHCRHNIVSVAGIDKVLYIISVDEKKVLRKSEVCESQIECLKYSYDADCIVAVLSCLKIKMFDSEELSPYFEINMKESSPEFHNINLGTGIPNITCISLTTTGEQVAVACWDRRVRIFQLPKVFNLQHLCKFTILSLIDPLDMKKLPIPRLLNDYLHSLPFNP